jgi:putative hydrolase of the HAD superfamily
VSDPCGLGCSSGLRRSECEWQAWFVLTLALDVDGVLLDSDRGGQGSWTNELTNRFGITRDQLRQSFFMRVWDDVVNGRRGIESALAESLEMIGSTAAVEEVLACWFEADLVVFDAAIDLARRAASAGIPVVLATNQEHRRARYLRDRLGQMVSLDRVFYSAEFGVQKHQSAFFEEASKQLGVSEDSRSEVIFVDDLLENVETARKSGWQAVQALPDFRWIAEVESILSLSAAGRG